MRLYLSPAVIGVALANSMVMSAATSDRCDVIPLVRIGSEIRIINDTPNREEFLLRSVGGDITIALDAHASYSGKSKSDGYAIVCGAPVTSYAIANGITIAATRLNTYVRETNLIGAGGLAIANPYDVAVNLTFWVRDNGGRDVASTNYQIPSGKSYALLANEWIRGLAAGERYSIVVASSLPIGIAAAEQIGESWSAITVRDIGTTISSPLDPKK